MRSIKKKPEHEVVISESGAHSVQLAREAGSKGFKAVVAVGGDGSVNEIGRQLIGSGIPMGIVPTGSGNGIARHFGISTKLSTAIRQAFRGHVKTIDTMCVNDEAAVGFCGVGFDGFVAQQFNAIGERGFSNYVKLTIDIFGSYEANSYALDFDGNQSEAEAYSVVVANARQFGNNAFINPTGREDDGFLELVIVRNFPKAAFASLASRLFLQNIHKSKYVETHRVTKVVIQNPGKEPLQIDGEYASSPKEVVVTIDPASLNILVPR